MKTTLELITINYNDYTFTVEASACSDDPDYTGNGWDWLYIDDWTIEEKYDFDGNDISITINDDDYTKVGKWIDENYNEINTKFELEVI